MSELRTEARLLLQTVEDRLVEWRSLLPTQSTTATAGTDPASEHAGHAGAPGRAGTTGTTSNGCPLCTLMAVLRGERPELAAALLDGAVTALQVVRSLVSGEPDQPVPDGTAADAPQQTDRPQVADPPSERDPAPSPDPALPAAPQRRPPERIRIS